MTVRWVNLRKSWFWARVALQVRGLDSALFALFIAMTYAIQREKGGAPGEFPKK